jgi:hypothetical protein
MAISLRIQFLGCLASCAFCATEADLRKALELKTGVAVLPAGDITLSREILIEGAHDLEIRGSGTRIRAALTFEGRAMFRFVKSNRVRIQKLEIDGNRVALETRLGLPPADKTFASFYRRNAIAAEDCDGFTVADVKFKQVASFAVLGTRLKNVTIERIEVSDSGSRNGKGRNNATGGVLLEEGTAKFTVRDSKFLNVRGNGVWTHSMYKSPRNSDGLITGNRFEKTARDAIQIGHATRVRVEGNTGINIGYPQEEIDIEGMGTPVAIDTAGNVDASSYTGNRFEEINGKCIDLDGFHDGLVARNTCINKGKAEDYVWGHFAIVMNNTNPDMQSARIRIEDNTIDGTKFGGIFVIGTANIVVRNRLRNLNRARCGDVGPANGCMTFPKEPELLQTGIYLGDHAERPAIAKGNRIADNRISGHGMGKHCVAAAPQVKLSENVIERNRCSE